MSNKTFAALKLSGILLIILNILLTGSMVGNVFFNLNLPDWFVFEDGIGSLPMYNSLILLAQVINIVFSIIYAFNNEGVNLKGFFWSLAFSSLNVISTAIWFGMEYSSLFGVNFAVIMLLITNLMNIFNYLAFIVMPLGNQQLK